MKMYRQRSSIVHLLIIGLILSVLTGCADSGHYNNRGYVISRSDDWTEEAESVMRTEEEP